MSPLKISRVLEELELELEAEKNRMVEASQNAAHALVDDFHWLKSNTGFGTFALAWVVGFSGGYVLGQMSQNQAGKSSRQT